MDARAENTVEEANEEEEEEGEEEEEEQEGEETEMEEADATTVRSFFFALPTCIHVSSDSGCSERLVAELGEGKQVVA